jgi:hypothetical protein
MTVVLVPQVETVLVLPAHIDLILHPTLDLLHKLVVLAPLSKWEPVFLHLLVVLLLLVVVVY